MRHYFLDTNVLLDFLLRRDGFGPTALHLFAASDSGQAMLYASSLSFNHIYYTMRKTNSAAERLAALTDLAALVEIIPVGRPVIEAALTLSALPTSKMACNTAPLALCLPSKPSSPATPRALRPGRGRCLPHQQRWRSWAASFLR
ncbi:MAG: PIN domain-containing protein [Hymenobacter sp.]|nr:MAG: PIN domain-containing protein [Hymenobacter sp.]